MTREDTIHLRDILIQYQDSFGLGNSHVNADKNALDIRLAELNAQEEKTPEPTPSQTTEDVCEFYSRVIDQYEKEVMDAYYDKTDASSEKDYRAANSRLIQAENQLDYWTREAKEAGCWDS